MPFAKKYKIVTTQFHELFKAAALDGNSKLAFGLAWSEILKTLKASFGGDGAATDLASKIESGELKSQFERLDQDGSGALSVDEVLVVMREMGGELTRGAVANLVRLADEDGSGTIDFDEFKAILLRVSGTA